MASAFSSNAFRHARSNSLPSRPHPVVSKLKEILSSLRSSETTRLTSSSVTFNITGLQDLHEWVDQLLLLPLMQHAFSKECHSRWADELLDSSLWLLDLYSTAKTSLLQMKDALQELQFNLRRRKGAESKLNIEIQKYLSMRKSVQKAIKQSILSLKARKDYSASAAIQDDEAAAFVTLLRHAEVATAAVFESVFCFISGSRPTGSSSSWSFISKMTFKKQNASTEEKADLNEFSKLDVALESDPPQVRQSP